MDFAEGLKMRQLKGKVKENAKEKRERKKEFMENKEKAFSIGKKLIGTYRSHPYYLCSGTLPRYFLKISLTFPGLGTERHCLKWIFLYL